MRRYNVKATLRDGNPATRYKKHGTVGDAQSLLYSPVTVSNRQYRWKDRLLGARQFTGIATKRRARMTEPHKHASLCTKRIDLQTGKLTADEKSVLARKDELNSGTDAAGCKSSQSFRNRRHSTSWRK